MQPDQTPNDKIPMTPLSVVLEKARQDGYTNDFTIRAGRLFTEAGKSFLPDEVKISNFYRFEGESDPGDFAILYLIETTDGTKGVIVSAYGPDTEADIQSFIRQVEDIHKVLHDKKDSK